jgi:hypothetical protein
MSVCHPDEAERFGELLSRLDPEGLRDLARVADALRAKIESEERALLGHMAHKLRELAASMEAGQ